MNSELVFSAAKAVNNRYLLCRLAARTVRTLHFASSNTQDAITDAFVRLGRPAPTTSCPTRPGFSPSTYSTSQSRGTWPPQ